MTAPDGGGYIRRAPKAQGHYTQILNDVIRDKRMSRGARGLHHEMLSYDANTRITMDMLLQGGPEGLHAIRSQLKELDELGYVIRDRKYLGAGKWEWEWIVGETPEEAKAAAEQPQAGNQPAGNQPVEKCPVASTGQTPVSAGQATGQFPTGGEPLDEDLKTLTAKTLKESVAEVPQEAPESPPDGPQMTRLIKREMRTAHKRDITPGQAKLILADIGAGTIVRPDTNWYQVVATAIRREQHVERWLPTSQPPRYVAPTDRPEVRDDTMADVRRRVDAIRAANASRRPLSDPLPVGAVLEEAAA